APSMLPDPLKSVVTLPPVPNVGSREPGPAARAAELETRTNRQAERRAAASPRAARRMGAGEEARFESRSIAPPCCVGLGMNRIHQDAATLSKERSRSRQRPVPTTSRPARLVNGDGGASGALG